MQKSHREFNTIISTNGFNLSRKMVFSISNKTENTCPDFRFVMHGKNPSVSSKIINYDFSFSITRKERKILLFGLVTCITNIVFINMNIRRVGLQNF